MEFNPSFFYSQSDDCRSNVQHAGMFIVGTISNTCLPLICGIKESYVFF